MGFAVCAAHRDPLAISGLFFAIAAILRTVPRIIEERARILREVEWQENVKACSSPAGDALATATATATATSALTATATTAVDVTAAADPANTARA